MNEKLSGIEMKDKDLERTEGDIIRLVPDPGMETDAGTYRQASISGVSAGGWTRGARRWNRGPWAGGINGSKVSKTSNPIDPTCLVPRRFDRKKK